MSTVQFISVLETVVEVNVHSSYIPFSQVISSSKTTVMDEPPPPPPQAVNVIAINTVVSSFPKVIISILSFVKYACIIP